MKRSVLFAVALAAVSTPALAHKMWLLPSATVLGENQWLTVDAAVSNDLFYFNHVPLRLDNLVITGPDGARVAAQNAHTGKYRSVFDVELAKPGTYRIAIVNDGLFASWTENGERKRWRGNAERFEREVPKQAEGLQVAEAQGRVETFVTAGRPNDAALKPSGRGLEMIAVTHPNDLYAGEPARLRFQLDGKPAAQLKITVVPGGTRYRDRQDELTFTTDAAGQVEITWPVAGMYWLEASISDGETTVEPASERRASYVATLEVLPQ